MEQEAIVLLENRATLPLTGVSKVAVIGPQSDRVSVRIHRFFDTD